MENNKLKLEIIFRKVFKNPNLVLVDEMSSEDISKWDSLNNIILLIEIENTFKIKFQPSDITLLKNVGDLRKLINNLIGT